MKTVFTVAVLFLFAGNAFAANAFIFTDEPLQTPVQQVATASLEYTWECTPAGCYKVPVSAKMTGPRVTGETVYAAPVATRTGLFPRLRERLENRSRLFGGRVRGGCATCGE